MKSILRRQAQKGRTMVEMLTVLAIIGVMSIGGIMSYNIAVQLFREAETVDAYSVTVAGGRTWSIVDTYGPQTDLGDEQKTPIIVPIREVVSKVNYSSADSWATANVDKKDIECNYVEEDGVEELKCNAEDIYYAKREYESYDALTLAPVFVRAEDTCSWSVRVVGLSNKLCKDIARKRTLGYDYIYRAKTDTKGNPIDPSGPDFLTVGKKFSNADIEKLENLNALCQSIDPTNSTKPLVQQYYEQFEDGEFEEVASKAGTRLLGEGKRLSVRHLAKDARVSVKGTEVPLQTLVLYFNECGAEMPDIPKDDPLACCSPRINPYTCTSGYVEADQKEIEECCEMMPGMTWKSGVCCQVGSTLDWLGNPNRVCGGCPDCFEGTPWPQILDPTSGNCVGNCGEGAPESKYCCKAELGGIWQNDQCCMGSNYQITAQGGAGSSSACPWGRKGFKYSTVIGNASRCSYAQHEPYDIYGAVDAQCCKMRGTAKTPFSLLSNQISETCCKGMGLNLVEDTTSCDRECCETGASDEGDGSKSFVNWAGVSNPEFCCPQDIGAKVKYKECCEAVLVSVSGDKPGIWVDAQSYRVTRANPCPSEDEAGDFPEKYKCDKGLVTTTGTCCDPQRSGYDISGKASIACCQSGDTTSPACCPLQEGYIWLSNNPDDPDSSSGKCVKCKSNCTSDCYGAKDGETDGLCRYGKELIDGPNGVKMVGTAPDETICCQNYEKSKPEGLTKDGVANLACCKEGAISAHGSGAPIDCRPSSSQP